MFPAQMSLQAVCIVAAAVVLMLLVAYVTHPPRAVFIGALIGGVVFLLLNILCDIGASALGYWHYPFTTRPYAPLWIYLAQASVWGVAVGMIGWRVQGCFGIKGLLLFILALSGIGTARDLAYGTLTHVIIFAPGITPVVVDWSCWLVLLSVAQLARGSVALRIGL
jgi:hypothetical protein